MKNKFKERVFLDVMAGPGYARSRAVAKNCLVALGREKIGYA